MNHLPSYLTLSEDASATLNEQIEILRPDKVVFLVDDHTSEHCLAKINVQNDGVIEIKSGEENKHLETCYLIWKQMTQYHMTRKSLLVNLGGGVIGDMGGFAAASYQRGIRFIQIPTTLLSQVDASIGGKLGVDFEGLKNHIGFFRTPDHVIVAPDFLETLPERELRSGFAEIIKHALISDADHWEKLRSKDFSAIDLAGLIPHSIAIKNRIVEEDPKEAGLRKVLNFGHTLGHAVESYFLESPDKLLHGEAVAIGMVLESHLSLQKDWLSNEEFGEVKDYLNATYPMDKKLPDIALLLPYLKHDKKNDSQGINFSLLKGIGKCEYDVKVSTEMITQSLQSFGT